MKTLIETQVETIKEMKEIDFASAMKGGMDGNDEIMGRDDEEKLDEIKYSGSKSKGMMLDDRSAYIELLGEVPTPINEDDDIEDNPNAPPIDVPEWLFDTSEEIAAFCQRMPIHGQHRFISQSKD